MLQLRGDFFHLPHNSQRIPAVNLFDVAGGISFLQERTSQVGKFRDIIETFRRAFDAIEIAADADYVDASNLAGVIDVRDNIGQSRAGSGRAFWSIRRLLRYETAIEVDLHYAALLRESPNHIVG